MESVIDAHLHLDANNCASARSAVDRIIEGMDTAGVESGVVLHLLNQPWSMEEVARALMRHEDRLLGFVNIDPTKVDSSKAFRNAVKNYGFNGLKLHPRLQRFKVDDKRVINLVKIASELNIPVLIDAFPDGDFLMDGFSSQAYGRLAQAVPEAKVIIAHMGGHHVLDFLMIAKRIPNIYFDFSFSLLYYRSSTVPQDLIYAMRSLNFERVFYGSDYPDRTIEETLQQSLDILTAAGVADEQLDKIMWRNAKEFFKWTDL